MYPKAKRHDLVYPGLTDVLARLFFVSSWSVDLIRVFLHDDTLH